MFGHIFNGEGGQNPLSKVVFEKKFVVLLLKKHDKKGTNCLKILGHSFLKASYIYINMSPIFLLLIMFNRITSKKKTYGIPLKKGLGHLQKVLRDAFQKSVS